MEVVMLQMARVVSSLVFIALTTIGCTTLPDVKPFAESTAALSAAAGTQYRDVSSEVASLEPQLQPGESESSATFATRKVQLEASQKAFAATEKSLDALSAAMTTYSEKVVSLTAAGKTGADAAQSLLDSANGFAQLGGLPAATVAAPITNAFKAIADAFTRKQAAKSLKEAVDAAQPGVNIVAEQFEVIYGNAMDLAIKSLRDTRSRQASQAAGPGVIGFNDNVKENYNAYYQFLNSFVTDFDPDAPASAWRGFCREQKTPCRAKEELEAVGLVEARMEAIRPIVETYNAQIASIEAKAVKRQAASKSVIKAVKAWALEHQKLRSSLEDGSSMSAFNLRAALMELSTLLGEAPAAAAPAPAQP
jgi:hypothetical protein